jgi:outer membrane protein OmpA-like peptidoglycan-associated protein
MRKLCAARPVGRAAAVILIAAGATAACGLLPAPAPGTARTLTLPAPRASVLSIVVDQNSATDHQLTSDLIGESARAGEHVFVLNDCGTLLASSVASALPREQAPVPPAPLSSHPTTFQKARHRQAETAYQQKLAGAKQSLQDRERASLASWAQRLTSQVSSGSGPSCSGQPDLSPALEDAAGTLSSLRQSGQGSATPETIAIIGVAPGTATTTPAPSASLLGSTVVVADFQGTSNAEGAWQASLDQAGAQRAAVLTPATDDQLATVVRQGLDGVVADTLTNVLFGLGQSTLEPAAVPQLQNLLRLLTVTYPGATASIYGYTDNLPVRNGSNTELSQQRADSVRSWLIAHHVAASRLQSAGYGDTDPVAANTLAGQPLNRRVVVVIDPAAGA